MIVPLKMNGIVQDLPPEEVPDDMWSSGINVMDRELSTRRVGGYDEYAETGWTAGDKPVFMLPIETPTQAYWIYVVDAATVKVMVTDGTTHWNITPAPAPSQVQLGRWTGTVLNGVPVLNNAVDPPWWWDGQVGNVMTVLPDWPTNQTCRALRAFKFHLVAMGITRVAGVFPDLVAWSDAAEPGTIPISWTPGADNDAGENMLADTPGGIIDGGKLRDVFLIYKSYSSTIMSFVGGVFVFAFRDSPSVSHGIQSQNNIAEDGGYQMIFTGDDVVRSDGQTSTSICTDEVRLNIVNRVDPEAFHMAMVTKRHLTDEVWVCIPQVGSSLLTMAYIYNTRSGKWGIRELPDVSHLEFGLVGNEGALSTWEDQIDAWQDREDRWGSAQYSESAAEILMSDYNGERLLIVDRLDSNAGVDVVAEVARESLAIGGSETIKTITEVWPHIDSEAGLDFEVRIGAQLDQYGPVLWSPCTKYVTGQTPAKFDCIATGRYFSFSFKTTGGKPWRHYGMDVQMREAGRY